jgi:heme o synthase
LTYLTTARPKMVALFVLVSLATMSVAGLPSAMLTGITLCAIALLVAGAATLNGYLERGLDRRMPRTAGRPLASGRLSPRRGLAFGAIVSLLGLVLLATGPGLVSFLLGLAGLIAYVVVYTLLLKPRVPESVVWGGPAGVFPLLIAWSASGKPWSSVLVYCCLLVFLWSPAHFWSLALARSDEYREAGVPVLPLARGEAWTRGLILLQLVLLSLLPLWAVASGFEQRWLVVVQIAAGLPLVWLAVRLARGAPPRVAWWLFRLSGPYLAVVFLVLVVARKT